MDALVVVIIMLLTGLRSDEGAGVPGGERMLFGSSSLPTRVGENVAFNTKFTW